MNLWRTRNAFYGTTDLYQWMKWISNRASIRHIKILIFNFGHIFFVLANEILLISDDFWLKNGNICILNIAAVADDVFKMWTTKQTSQLKAFPSRHFCIRISHFVNNLSTVKSLYCCIWRPSLVRLCVLNMHGRACLFGWQWGWWTARHHPKDVWKSIIAADMGLFATTASATWMLQLPVAVFAIGKFVLHI